MKKNNYPNQMQRFSEFQPLEWLEMNKDWERMAKQLHNDLVTGLEVDPTEFGADNKERYKIFNEVCESNPAAFKNLISNIKAGKSKLSYVQYIDIITGYEIKLKPSELRKIIEHELKKTSK